MLCRSSNCGAEGLFHKTEGFCRRCYEEIHSDEGEHSTDYYDKKVVRHEEMLPFLAWLAIVGFVMFTGRALWMMFTN